MSIHEECGVFGIVGNANPGIAREVYHGLYALQHRGQESCGIVVNDDGVFISHKDRGLVGEVFSENELSAMPGGRMAIGHVRYGTTGGGSRSNIQPMVVAHKKGNLALAHNGNLTNALELRDYLELSGAIFHSTSDTETICYMITRERLKTPSIEQAVLGAMRYFTGAYSLVMMSATKLIAVRDRKGFRPLCYGKRPDGSFAAASESCALDAVGASFVRDLLPGEMLVFSADDPGSEPVSYRMHCGGKISPCIFEYIYFARPDSLIDGISVHETRVRAGRILAREFPANADVVVGVPDSGLDAAIGYAAKRGPDRRFDRTGDDQPADHRPDQGGRRAGDPPEGFRTAVPPSLLLRGRHRFGGASHREQALRGGDRGTHRGGFARISSDGESYRDERVRILLQRLL